MRARKSPSQSNGTPRIASILATIRVFGAMCYTQPCKPAGAITMAVQQKLYTADDLWALSHAGDDRRYELDEGELIEMSPTGDAHGITAGELLRQIGNFVVENDLGDVTAAETGFTLSTDPDIVRAPDVGFISKARLTPLTGKYYPIAPDLAVEVVSPGDSAEQIRRKAAQYLEAGTRLAWFFYPHGKLVDIYRPGQPTETVGIDGVLDGGDVLPGFKLSVREVFKRLRE
jgi:Uma2 family endonuclease